MHRLDWRYNPVRVKGTRQLFKKEKSTFELRRSDASLFKRSQSQVSMTTKELEGEVGDTRVVQETPVYERRFQIQTSTSLKHARKTFQP